MNSISTIIMPASSCLYFISFTLFLFSTFSITSSSSTILSYNDHCSSFVPQSNTTVRTRTHSTKLPSFMRTIYFTGGEKLLGDNKNSFNFYTQKSLRLRITRNTYQTTENGIYKLEAYLYIRTPNGYRSPRNISYDHRNRSYDGDSGPIVFVLNGFWSEFTRKLCMVGSASLLSPQSRNRFLTLDAVLKLKFANEEDPTIHTSVISGTLESTSSLSSLRYFDPISIFSFPSSTNYDYSLVSKEVNGKGLSGGDDDAPKNEFRVLESGSFCSVISGSGESYFELEAGFMPRFVALYVFQCSWDERKVRYLVTFNNASYVSSYRAFGLNSTFIAEGSWDDKNNRVLIVGCQILSPSDDSGSVVGDCTLRLSLRYPFTLTLRNYAKIVGHVWTNKTVNDSGYFRKTKLKSLDTDNMGDFPGLRYEYTELNRVRYVCVAKKFKKKKGDIYPDGLSYDMRFDMDVKNSKGQRYGSGYAFPLFVGNELYEKNNVLVAMSPQGDVVEPARMYEQRESIQTSFNISYKISLNFFPAVNSSINPQESLQLDAEGVYNTETGQLCMVGCRKVQNSTNDSLDCRIVVDFEFAPMNKRSGNHVIKGTIRSTREKADPLYFEDMSLSSAAYYQSEAKKSIWRMDLEISMVLISNTFLCIFVALQIFHVKRNPEALSGVSIIMLLVLSLGLMIPLVLNFEAFFSERHQKERLEISGGGWLEANEVTIRVVTLVAFLLQIRLLQLVWTSKTSNENGKLSWPAEKITVFVSLCTYALGCLLTVLLNGVKNERAHETVYSYGVYPQYSMWGDLRSFAGLVLDGFLLPQVLLNALRGSTERALCHPFYIGTSVIRVVPHAYDQYRAHNYPPSYVNGTYYYANPTTDFYSTAWDVMIPCGVVVLAVVVFFQQRRGGRCILPKRFRELELYEKVPVVENE